MSKWRYIALLALILGLAQLFALRSPPKPEFATYYDPARPIGEFHLNQTDGSPFAHDDLRGHWTFVLIGYTFCPDICPTALADMRGIYPELQRLDGRSQVMFVSVDPGRDDLARLQTYVRFFQPAFLSASGPQSALFPFARSLGLVYAIVDEQRADKRYLVDHSASIALINPQGDLQALFRPEIRADAPPRVDTAKLVADFARIVARDGSL